MDFARSKSRSTALWALGGLVLAAFVAGGCTTPKHDERASFTTVSGTVRTATGDPLSDATVTVVRPGTVNYFGPETFTTNSAGRFFIPAVQVRGANPVILRLQASAPGFTPRLLNRTVPGTNAVVSDIQVGTTPISDLSASLPTAGASVTVGANGATVSATAITPLQGVSTGRVDVIIPAGALATSTPITVTPLTGGTLAAPAPNASGTPVVVVATAGQTTINIPQVQVPVAAVALEPSGQTFSQPVTVRLPLANNPGVATLGVRFFDVNSGTWVSLGSNATVKTVDGQLVAEFQTSHFTDFIVFQTADWTITRPATAAETIDFPPLADEPDGYTVGLAFSLDFPGLSDAQRATLIGQFESLSVGAVPGNNAGLSDPANKDDLTVQVPAPGPVVSGSANGLRCQRYTFTVVRNASDGTRTGTRKAWICATQALPVATEHPIHFQGHGQGGVQ